MSGAGVNGLGGGGGAAAVTFTFWMYGKQLLQFLGAHNISETR